MPPPADTLRHRETVVDGDPIELVRVTTTGARRQAMILMVALREHDQDLARMAVARIRVALGAAQRTTDAIAEQTATKQSALAMLHAARETVAPWLAEAGTRLDPMITAGGLERLVARFGSERQPMSDVLANLDLAGADLAGATLSGLLLVSLRASGANFGNAILSDARLVGCELSAASAMGIRLDRSTIDDCAFEHSKLTRSSWAGAHVRSTSFVGSVMIDARLAGATFAKCDLRGANLSIADSTVPQDPVITTFIECDLRDTRWSGRSVAGVRFIDCAMYGVRGVPSRGDGVEIVRADLSCGADRSWVVESARTWGDLGQA